MSTLADSHDRALTNEALLKVVNRLQRRVRAMTGFGLAVFTAVFLCLACGSSQGSDQAAEDAPQAIEATQITLVDNQGHKRLQMGVSEGIAYIKLGDVHGEPHLILAVGPGPNAEASVSLFDDDKVRLASLSTSEESGFAVLRGRHPSLEVFDKDGGSRVGLGLEKVQGQDQPEAALGIRNASGQNFITARMVNDAPKVFLVDGARKSEIRMGIEGDYDGFLTFNKGESARLLLGIDPDIKQPTLQYFPSTGGKPRMVFSLAADVEKPVLVAGDRVLIAPTE